MYIGVYRHEHIESCWKMEYGKWVLYESAPPQGDYFYGYYRCSVCGAKTEFNKKIGVDPGMHPNCPGKKVLDCDMENKFIIEIN